jgi:hypothetical protein
MQKMRAVLINTTFQLGHHGCTLIDRQLDQLAAAADVHIAAKIPLYGDWDRAKKEDFAAVIVNGEGSVHHDSKAARRIAEVPRWAQSLNKPAYLINTIYEANGAEVAAAIAQYTHVFARDNLSREELARAGIAASGVPDLTLTWCPPSLSRSGRAIVVTDSTLKNKTVSLHSFATRVGGHFMPLLARPPGPFDVLGTPGRWARFKMRRLAAHVAPPSLWRDRWRNAIPDFDHFVAWLAEHAAMIVTGRFHAVCVALALEIPVLALPSNTRKIESLLNEIGLNSRIILDLDELAARLANGDAGQFAYRAEEIAEIRSFRRGARKKALDMFSTIRQMSQGYR